MTDKPRFDPEVEQKVRDYAKSLGHTILDTLLIKGDGPEFQQAVAPAIHPFRYVNS